MKLILPLLLLTINLFGSFHSHHTSHHSYHHSYSHNSYHPTYHISHGSKQNQTYKSGTYKHVSKVNDSDIHLYRTGYKYQYYYLLYNYHTHVNDTIQSNNKEDLINQVDGISDQDNENLYIKIIVISIFVMILLLIYFLFIKK